MENNEVLSSPILEEPPKAVSKKQYEHLARARQIKADKKEVKIKQSEAYIAELKNVYLHLERLSTQFNQFNAAIVSLKPQVEQPPAGSKRKAEDLEEPTIDNKKQKTKEEEESPTTEWLHMIAQIIGASAAVGTLYLFRRYTNPDPDNPTVNRYKRFAL